MNFGTKTVQIYNNVLRDSYKVALEYWVKSCILLGAKHLFPIYTHHRRIFSESSHSNYKTLISPFTVPMFKWKFNSIQVHFCRLGSISLPEKTVQTRSADFCVNRKIFVLSVQTLSGDFCGRLRRAYETSIVADRKLVSLQTQSVRTVSADICRTCVATTPGQR